MNGHYALPILIQWSLQFGAISKKIACKKPHKNIEKLKKPLRKEWEGIPQKVSLCQRRSC